MVKIPLAILIFEFEKSLLEKISIVKIIRMSNVNVSSTITNSRLNKPQRYEATGRVILKTVKRILLGI